MVVTSGLALINVLLSCCQMYASPYCFCDLVWNWRVCLGVPLTVSFSVRDIVPCVIQSWCRDVPGKYPIFTNYSKCHASTGMSSKELATLCVDLLEVMDFITNQRAVFTSILKWL